MFNLAFSVASGVTWADEWNDISRVWHGLQVSASVENICPDSSVVLSEDACTSLLAEPSILLFRIKTRPADRTAKYLDLPGLHFKL